MRYASGEVAEGEWTDGALTVLEEAAPAADAPAEGAGDGAAPADPVADGG